MVPSATLELDSSLLPAMPYGHSRAPFTPAALVPPATSVGSHRLDIVGSDQLIDSDSIFFALEV
jgi:hypothetical protein